MNTEKYQESMDKIKKCFPKAFVNMNNELIINKERNTYFFLGNIESDLDFQCKMLEWLSRPILKEYSDKMAKNYLKRFNQFFNHDFTMRDIEDIYAELGNNSNRQLCKQFILSDFNMKLLE